MGEMRSAYNTLVEKYVENRPLRRYKLRWESNIRMDLMESVGRYGSDSCGSGMGPLAISCSPSDCINYQEFLTS